MTKTQSLSVTEIDQQLTALAEENAHLIARQNEIESAIADAWQSKTDTSTIEAEYAQNALKLKSSSIVKARLESQRAEAVINELWAAYDTAAINRYEAVQTETALKADVDELAAKLETAKKAFSQFAERDTTSSAVNRLEREFEQLGISRDVVQQRFHETYTAQAAKPSKRKAG